MLALSIRQPYAELILRGVKTAELRGRPTKIIGQRFYIYAAKSKAKPPTLAATWSGDLQVASPPAWMLELANQVKLIPDEVALPTGVIVGSAVIERVVEPKDPTDIYHWRLAEVERFKDTLTPRGHPQPVWWKPF